MMNDDITHVIFARFARDLSPSEFRQFAREFDKDLSHTLKKQVSIFSGHLKKGISVIHDNESKTVSGAVFVCSRIGEYLGINEQKTFDILQKLIYFQKGDTVADVWIRALQKENNGSEQI